jgi:hypothetical protein
MCLLLIIRENAWIETTEAKHNWCVGVVEYFPTFFFISTQRRWKKGEKLQVQIYYNVQKYR